MTVKLKDNWVRFFKQAGYPSAAELAAGMECAVYVLVPGELVAKVWKTRARESLEQLQSLYRELGTRDLAIRTPEILSLETHQDTLVTKEAFLPGVPLNSRLSADAESANARAVDATIAVLDVLRSVSAFPEARQLSVLDERETLWRGQAEWSDALSGLLRRRAALFGEQLADDVPDYADLLRSCVSFLRTRDATELTLIHGDICSENIMVDDALRPVALLDFGFLSTAGDPTFDAAVAGAIFNMYGPHSRLIEDELTDATVESLGYDRRVLLCYRAVYALLTSNAYSVEGADGHYRWCIDLLNRNDVRAALEVPKRS